MSILSCEFQHEGMPSEGRIFWSIAQNKKMTTRLFPPFFAIGLFLSQMMLSLQLMTDPSGLTDHCWGGLALYLWQNQMYVQGLITGYVWECYSSTLKVEVLPEWVGVLWWCHTVHIVMTRHQQLLQEHRDTALHCGSIAQVWFEMFYLNVRKRHHWPDKVQTLKGRCTFLCVWCAPH
jgi:hypothetical protein